jgi:hypothetical protein
VPSMCLLIKDSTLVAVVWRCGLVAAHLRAVSGSAGPLDRLRTGDR